MNQKELKELIDFLIEKDISEFELERGDVKVGSSAEWTHTRRSFPMLLLWLPTRPLRCIRSTCGVCSRDCRAIRGAR